MSRVRLITQADLDPGNLNKREEESQGIQGGFILVKSEGETLSIHDKSSALATLAGYAVAWLLP